MPGKTKTAITDDMLLRVEELAAKGFNNILISQSLDIGITTLSRNTRLKQSIQRGKLTLSERITQSVLDTLEEDSSTRQLLVKRLCLFNPAIDIVKPTNAKQALSNLSAATKAYANGEINESQLRTIEAVSNSFVKGYDATILEDRIVKLEDAQNGNIKK